MITHRHSLANRAGALVPALALALALGLNLHAAADWQPAAGPLLTRWAKDVTPAKAQPEYPRPQLVRADWLNLNGLWDYAIVDKTAPQPTACVKC
jgi:hypothetical protein